MYTNIRAAIVNLKDAFDSAKTVDAIEEASCEPFTHFELLTINEQIGKYKRHQLIDLMHPNARKNLSELMSDFLGCVQIEL